MPTAEVQPERTEPLTVASKVSLRGYARSDRRHRRTSSAHGKNLASVARYETLGDAIAAATRKIAFKPVFESKFIKLTSPAGTL